MLVSMIMRDVDHVQMGRRFPPWLLSPNDWGYADYTTILASMAERTWQVLQYLEARKEGTADVPAFTDL